MIVALLIRWLVLAGAFALTAWILSGLDVSGGFFGYLWVSLLFGVVNAVIGTLLRLLTLPLILLTFGLFSFVVNALMLQLVDALSDHLTIDEFFWTAIWAAIILSVVGVILELIVKATLGAVASD